MLMATSLLAFVLLSSVCRSSLASTHMIEVSQNGCNDEACLTDDGSTPCCTLQYIMLRLSSVETESDEVKVLVGYNQTLANATASVPKDKAFVITGAGNCTDKLSGESPTQDSQECPPVRLEVINFDFIGNESSSSASEPEAGLMEVALFDEVTFSNCSFLNGTSIVIKNVQNVQLSGCQFRFHTLTQQVVGIVYESDFPTSSRGSAYVSLTKCTFANNTALQKTLRGCLAVRPGMNNQLCNTSLPASRTRFNASHFVAVVGVHLNVTPGVDDDSSILVNISDCSFTENDLSKVPRSSVFAMNIHSSFDQNYLILSRSRFTKNHGRVIYMKHHQDSTRRVVVDVHDNLIEKNLVPLTDLFALVSFWFNAQEHDTKVEVYFTNNIINSSFGTGLRFVTTQFTQNATSFFLLANSTFNNLRGPVLYAICIKCDRHRLSVSIEHASFSNNFVPDPTISTVNIDSCVLHLSNTNFTDNIGTGMVVRNTKLSLFRTLRFEGNVGLYGGGCHLGRGVNLAITSLNATLMFRNNVAVYGGAVYLSSELLFHSNCVHFPKLNGSCVTLFEDSNKATVAGDFLYLDAPVKGNCTQFVYDILCNSDQITSSGFASTAISISFNSTTNSTCTGNFPEVSVFPGQNVNATATVLDAYNFSATCIATVYLQCKEQYVVCSADNSSIQLKGPGDLTLTNNQSLLPIQIQAPNGNLTFCPKIVFQCPYTNVAVLAVNITSCPLGFTYNPMTRVCQCSLNGSDQFQCSASEGAACVATSYWYGQISVSNDTFQNVTWPCDYSFCSPQFSACNLSIYNSTKYILLPKSADQQCNQNHGDVLCRGCMSGSTPSFQATQCILDSQCTNWQPYLILALALLFQLVLSLSIVFVVRYLKEVGPLYGPLFYVAVVNHLPFQRVLTLYQLKLIVSVFSSELLLNLSAFGYIPWCFFSFGSYSTLVNFSFQFLGPLISLGVLLSIFACAQRCPKLYIYLKITPIQSICVLALLSFWTVTDTSIELLKWQGFEGVSTRYVYIQPSIPYFSEVHIPLAVFSAVILIILVTPFVTLLLFTPLLEIKFNLSRLHPFLDVFRSSLKDNFRWYPAVLLITWLLYLMLDDIYFIASQLILILTASIHFLLQPFRKSYHNVTNSLLLFDLVLVSSFVIEARLVDESETVQVVVYILTLTPLVWFILVVGAFLLNEMGVTAHLKKLVWSKGWQKLPINNDTEDYRDSLERTSSAVVTGNRPILLEESGNARLRESLLESFH